MSGVGAFEQAVVTWAVVPGEDAVLVAFDEGDEVFDGLQAGAFGARCTSCVGSRGRGWVLVVEGLEPSCQRMTRAV
jgi:hypothetical protein